MVATLLADICGGHVCSHGHERVHERVHAL